jgi:CubicO group peptidase (beta-lactamase class C family)
MDQLDQLALETGFSGVVRVDRGGVTQFAKAYGFAHRGYRVPNTVDTRFAIASGTKGLTALTVVSLIEDGKLSLDTKAREVLGDDLPLVDDAVTVEHLLGNRSGIGDFIDEDGDITDYALGGAPNEFHDTEQYLKVLDGRPALFPPGEQFSYCNAGFVVLALIAERVSGVPYHQLVRERVCEPAGMVDTDFLRSDEPGEHTAVGYLPIDGVSRTNVFHLPVRGNGDGGIYSTVADFAEFWPAFVNGRIVSADWVAEMIRPRSDGDRGLRYGLGFWRPASGTLMLEGYDAGVSFRSVHDPDADLTHTVISNTTDGTWPITRFISGTPE